MWKYLANIKVFFLSVYIQNTDSSLSDMYIFSLYAWTFDIYCSIYLVRCFIHDFSKMYCYYLYVICNMCNCYYLNVRMSLYLLYILQTIKHAWTLNPSPVARVTITTIKTINIALIVRLLITNWYRSCYLCLQWTHM